MAPLTGVGNTRCSVAGTVSVTGSDSDELGEMSALREAEGVELDVLNWSARCEELTEDTIRMWRQNSLHDFGLGVDEISEVWRAHLARFGQ